MSDLTSSLETVRSTIVTNLTSKGVSCSTTENLNDLIAKTNTVKTPVTTTLTLQDTYPNTLEGLMTCLRDKFRINLSKQGVETLSTDGLTTLSNSISLIKLDTVLTLTSNKTSASIGETVTLTATLVDINGNAISGATINFMEGSNTLYSGITDSTGKVNYSYSSSTEGSKSLKCVFDGTINYNSSNSNIGINITNILYNPALDGSENIITQGGVSPVITNNMLVGGIGYLTAGFTNKSTWKLTLDYKFTKDQNRVVLIDKNNTNNVIGISTDNALAFTKWENGSATEIDRNNYNSGTWYTFTLTRTGTTSFTYDLGQGTNGTFNFTGFNSITDLVIGTFYWNNGGTTNTYIKNIKVVQV